MTLNDNITKMEIRQIAYKSDTRPNQNMSLLVVWADWKQLFIASQKSSVTLFPSDARKFWLLPQVRVADAIKSWGVKWETLLTLTSLP